MPPNCLKLPEIAWDRLKIAWKLPETEPLIAWKLPKITWKGPISLHNKGWAFAHQILLLHHLCFGFVLPPTSSSFPSQKSKTKLPWSSFPCFFGERKENHRKKQGFFSLCWTPRIPGKEGKNAQKARKVPATKKARKSKKARKGRSGLILSSFQIGYVQTANTLRSETLTYRFFIFWKKFRENLPIPIPICNYFELISFTDTDSYPPSGLRPQKITDM